MNRDAESSSPCQMPGCSNQSDPGRLLCSACRGENAPADPNKNRVAPIPMTGLTVEQQAEAAGNHKKRKPAWNRKPRVTLICPCGKRFTVPAGAQEQRKYCSMVCKKRYFHPDGSIHTKWPLPPGFDEELRTIYEEKVRMMSGRSKNHPNKNLAEKYGVPRWKVSRRAMQLCLIPTSKKDPIWSDEELGLLQKFAHFTPHCIQAKFRQAGYKRSENAISVKLTRTGARQLCDVYTAREAASVFGIDQSAVRKWIEKGFLAAERRGTARVAAQSGDMWSIGKEAIRAHIKENPEMVDFRKIDKYFVAGLL